MKYLILVLVALICSVFAHESTVDMTEPMQALATSFADLSSQVSAFATENPNVPPFTGMSSDDLSALLLNTKKQIEGTDPRAIPAELTTTVTTLSQKIFALQDRMKALTDMHHNEQLKAAETFKTPGSPLVGFSPNVTTGAQADRLAAVFKATQKVRKISNEEVENNYPGHVDTKAGF